MPGVKNITSYVSNISHTLSPAYTTQTYNNHIQYRSFSKHFFNKVRLNNTLTGWIVKPLLTVISMLIHDEFILKPTKYFKPRDIQFK